MGGKSPNPPTSQPELRFNSQTDLDELRDEREREKKMSDFNVREIGIVL